MIGGGFGFGLWWFLVVCGGCFGGGCEFGCVYYGLLGLCDLWGV